jgi:hypothetical protein
VAADTAYQNAKKKSDKQNARIEHDKGTRPRDDGGGGPRRHPKNV